KKIIVKISLLVAMAFSLVACHNVPIWNQDMFAKPPGNKQYPNKYVTGWQHGCVSGAEASANHFYRWKYKFTQDWRLLNNNYYVKGWEDSYDYCRQFVAQHNIRTFN
ncbi:MAG: hypothetical protein AAF195_04680, partial [Pseudomonadota bacterium]